ncbi:hypothetical protein ACTJIJ_14865 [Niabella sp. 22666]|uniref:hypothetical protein n=1 Tax=Niabella sp. 22666 TaxID=3453954 RepID=UPI003F82D435
MKVVFHGVKDPSTPYYLKIAENVLTQTKLSGDSEVNDLLEYYNIKLYFDHDLFLKTWTEEQKQDYQAKVSGQFDALKKYLLKINDGSLINELSQVEFHYVRHFWKVFCDINRQSSISPQVFEDLLIRFPRQLIFILRHRRLVEKFNTEIRNFMLNNPGSAELLLQSNRKDSTENRIQLLMPKSLTVEDKETLINAYLDQEVPNLNYVRIIEHIKDSSELKLEARTKLKAKKKSAELNEKVFENGSSFHYGVQIVLDKDQKEPIIARQYDDTYELSYSEQILDILESEQDLFIAFQFMFQYLDKTSMINGINRASESNVMEKIQLRSKNEYETNTQFRVRDYQAQLQIRIFEHYLNRKEKSLTGLINSFIQYINKELLTGEGIIFQIRETEASTVEKIRTIFADLDFLLKQYQALAKDKVIDIELLQIDSTAVTFNDTKSTTEIKYIYEADTQLRYLQGEFWSDDSLLSDIDLNEDGPDSFALLVTKNHLTLQHFNDIQQQFIQELIEQDHLRIDKAGRIRLVNEPFIHILRQFHLNGCINYWNESADVRKEIDVLLAKMIVKSESTLFSRQEATYFNYLLNKKEFTNGMDLRNKYMHGVNGLSEKDHQKDFYLLLRIVILILLKINDDLIISRIKAKENNLPSVQIKGEH